MPWLLPALIATVSCTGLLAALYLALYLRHRRDFLALWGACWAAYSLSLGVAISQASGYSPPAMPMVRNLLALASAWLLWQGVNRFLERPGQRWWNVATLAVAAAILIEAAWLSASGFLEALNALFVGLLQVAGGWLLWRASAHTVGSLKFAGLSIALWGVHRADYFFLKHNAWFVPWGYIIAAVLTFGVGLGLLLVFFERLRRDLVQAQGAAQSNLDMLDSILSAAPVGIALARERRMVWVNQAFHDFSGHDPQHWLGKETRGLYPSDLEFERVGRIIAPQLAVTGWAEVETEVVKADGTAMPVQLRMKAVDRKDPMAGYIVSVNDISEIKMAQAELARVTRVLRAITACHRALLHADEETALTEEICRIICQEGGYRMAWVGMLDDRGEAVPLSRWGHEEGYLKAVRISASDEKPHGRGPLGRALGTGRTAVAQNVLSDPSFAPWRAEAVMRGYASVAGLPLKAGNRPFGVLGIYAAQADAFNADELKLLTGLADDLAFGLETLRARGAGRQAEEALRVSEERYRRIVETSQEGIWTADEKYLTTFVNPRLAALLGYSAAEMIGRPITDFMVEDELADQQSKVNERRRGRSQRFLRRFRRKEGGHIWALVSATPVIGQEGEFLGSLAMLSDISERVAAEKALRESEERHRLLVESANEGIVVAQDGMVKFFNSRMLEITGFTAEEYVSRPFIEHVHPEDRARVMERHRSRSRGDTTPNADPFRIIDKRGKTRWLRPNGVFVEWEGKPATLGFFTDITEARQTQEALRDSEVRYRLISENARDIVCLHDAQMRVLYASPSVAQVLGWSPEEYMSRPVFEFLHPDDAAGPAREAFARLQQGEGDAFLRARARRKDGSYIWLETLASSLRDEKGVITGFLAASRDISERVEAEERLLASEERYRLLSENTQDIVCLHDRELRVLYVSPSVTKALGFQPQEVLGQCILDLMHPDDRDAVVSRLDSIGQEPGEVTLRNENRLRTKGGDYVWMETLSVPVPAEDGAIRFFQTTSRDISERKRSEEALRQLAAGVAHNFNNVLMAVLSNAQFAQALVTQGKQDSGSLARHLSGVVQGALAGRDVVQRLNRLVGPSFEWSHPRRTVEVRGLLASLRQMLEDTWPQIRAGSVGLSVESKGDFHFAGSAGEIMEVLLNLAKNAVEAMPLGGSLSVGAEAERERLVISVGDTGSGLAAEAQARLFEPFFSTKGVAGQGLGLAVSKAIIQAHGGTISVSSRPGRTVFTLRLPLVPPPSPVQVLPQAGPVTRPLRVLLVEDEALVAMGLVAILQRVGHQVRHVGTLARALEALADFSPQAVLCDLGLPDAHGWQVVVEVKEALRAMDACEVPVVAISGWSSRQLDGDMGEPPSGVQLLQKPVEAGRLLDTLSRAVI